MAPVQFAELVDSLRPISDDAEPHPTISADMQSSTIQRELQVTVQQPQVHSLVLQLAAHPLRSYPTAHQL